MNMYLRVYGWGIMCVYVINEKNMHMINKKNAE